MIKVTDRDGETHELEWEVGQTLMEALRDNDMPILASCGGCCSCATCHVFVDSHHIQQLGQSEGEERELLEETDAFRPDRSRLSCQISYDASLGEIAVTLAPEE